jgi:hypothetical protein
VFSLQNGGDRESVPTLLWSHFNPSYWYFQRSRLTISL